VTRAGARLLWLLVVLAPPAVAAADPTALAVAFVADAFGGRPAPALAALRALAPDGLFLIGDVPHDDPGANCGTAAGCLAKMRAVYERLYGGGSPLGADFKAQVLDAGVPVLARINDDHDWARNDASSKFRWWPEALQAFQEHHAIPPDNGLAHGYAYQGLRVGRALFLLLDVRTHRETDAGARRTILGAEQKAWLADRLAEAASDPAVAWTVLVSPVPFNPNQDKLDSWSGYAADRRWLLDAIAAAGLLNVLVVSGDCHFGSVVLPPLSPLAELNVPKLNAGFANTCNNRDDQWTLNSERAGSGFGLLVLSEGEAALSIVDEDGTLRLSAAVPRVLP